MRASRAWRTASVLRACVLTLLLVGCSPTKGDVVPSATTSTASLSPASVLGATETANAIAVAASKGYPDCQTSLYDGSSSHLHVLVCAARGASASNQLAFFFRDATFLGTDTAGPSARILASWRTDDTVALLYELYRPSDPMCCPTGGGAIVRYRWDGSRLQPLDPVPTDLIDAPLSRR